MSFLAIGAGVGAVGGAYKIYNGIKQNNLADKINPVYQQYEKSPFATQQLGTANNFLNGRMAGAGAWEQNIGQSQANSLANISRNATDSSTQLALAGATQGVADKGYSDLATAESRNKYNLLDNLNAAYATNIREGDKVNQSQLDKYRIDTGTQNGLRNGGMQNIAGGINDFASLGILASQYGAAGRQPQAGYNDYGFSKLPPNYLNTGG